MCERVQDARLQAAKVPRSAQGWDWCVSAELNVGEEMTVLFAQEQPRCRGQIAIGTWHARARHCMHGRRRDKMTSDITSQAKTKRLFLNKKYFDCRIPGLIL